MLRELKFHIILVFGVFSYKHRTSAYFHRIKDFDVFSFLIILIDFGDFSFDEISFDGFSLRRNLIAPYSMLTALGLVLMGN